MKRQVLSLSLLVALTAAGAATAVSLSNRPKSIEPPETAPRFVPTAPAAPSTDKAVLLRVFRGRTRTTRSEISVSTIFRGPSFSVLADPDITGSTEQELTAHLKEIFSLKEVVSLGSGRVELAGGSAVMDDDGHSLEIHVEGQPAGRNTVRLMVSQTRDGAEVVATSVIARHGKTVVLAGPSASGSGDDGGVSFVCLTPL